MGIIKDLIPPILIKGGKTLFGNRYGWKGSYDSWEAAQKVSSGYETQVIINKVKESLLKVKNGEFTFERDSVLFADVEYSWPVLSALSGYRLNIWAYLT